MMVNMKVTTDPFWPGQASCCWCSSGCTSGRRDRPQASATVDQSRAALWRSPWAAAIGCWECRRCRTSPCADEQTTSPDRLHERAESPTSRSGLKGHRASAVRPTRRSSSRTCPRLPATLNAIPGSRSRPIGTSYRPSHTHPADRSAGHAGPGEIAIRRPHGRFATPRRLPARHPRPSESTSATAVRSRSQRAASDSARRKTQALTNTLPASSIADPA